MDPSDTATEAMMIEEWFGLARALDRVGDRWTLLIARELLPGPRCFEELREALPGIARSKLADRLVEMASNGLIAHRTLDGAEVFDLTQEGRGLREAILALTRWSERSRSHAPSSGEFRLEQLALVLRAALPADDGGDPSLQLRVTAGGRVVRFSTAEGDTIATLGTTEVDNVVDLVVRGDPRLLVALAAGSLSFEHAEERGVVVRGATRKRRLLQRAVA